MANTDKKIKFVAALRFAEGVDIYTHSHTILPGVTIGKQAIVGGRSLVTKDVEPNMVAAGVPAKVMRERRNEGRMGKDLKHIWFHNGAYQK